ncbi:MAG: hypothetical protein KGN84_18880, partial [Acidobacteriota bacterium]|nr:hypothetical protein [Acidobacteriota bacterium]
MKVVDNKTAPDGNKALSKSFLTPYLSIARFDHWVKNVFALPGIVIACSVAPPVHFGSLLLRIIAGMLGLGLVASSNYVLNEVLDAPFDK